MNLNSWTLLPLDIKQFEAFLSSISPTEITIVSSDGLKKSWHRDKNMIEKFRFDDDDLDRKIAVFYQSEILNRRLEGQYSFSDSTKVFYGQLYYVDYTSEKRFTFIELESSPSFDILEDTLIEMASMVCCSLGVEMSEDCRH